MIPIMPAPVLIGDATAMLEAVLVEVRVLLARLAGNPEQIETIDLNSLPLDARTRALLRDRLGQGEVVATIEAAGRSQVVETAYPGVWWIRHETGEDDSALEQITVARVPALLCAHPVDIERASLRLADDLGRMPVPRRAGPTGSELLGRPAQDNLEASDG